MMADDDHYEDLTSEEDTDWDDWGSDWDDDDWLYDDEY